MVKGRHICISTDTCYILSFAIIMLNTSLHNPNVKDKPTVERFISMNRGINDGGDLPEELLRVSLFLSHMSLSLFFTNSLKAFKAFLLEIVIRLTFVRFLLSGACYMLQSKVSYWRNMGIGTPVCWMGTYQLLLIIIVTWFAEKDSILTLVYY